MKSGTLPAGLALDPTTGAITGTTQAAGSYSASVQATLTSPYGTYQLPPASYGANVSVLGMGYLNVGGTGNSQFGMVSYLSQPFRAVPIATGPAGPGPSPTFANVAMTGGTLPPGLVLDPATGVISGSPTGPTAPDTRIEFSGDVLAGGVSQTTSGSANISVAEPLSYRYQPLTASVNVAVAVDPAAVQSSPLPLVSASASFAAAPGPRCNLPPGITVDPVSGRAFGVPTSTGLFSCDVGVSITNNGFTWTSTSFLIVQVD